MGTSRNRLKHDKQTWDHPHAYGDKFLTKNGYLPDEGSSPRVWGQGVYNDSNGKLTGIIPTRMGTRYLLCFLLKTFWDHPHAYGDKGC